MTESFSPSPPPPPPKPLGTVYRVFPLLVPETDETFSDEFLTCAYYDMNWMSYTPTQLRYHPNPQDGTSYNVTFVLGRQEDIPGTLANPPNLDPSQVLHSASAGTLWSPASDNWPSPDPLKTSFPAIVTPTAPMIIICAPTLSADPYGPVGRAVVLVFETRNAKIPTGFRKRSRGLVATSDPEIMPST